MKYIDLIIDKKVGWVESFGDRYCFVDVFMMIFYNESVKM